MRVVGLTGGIACGKSTVSDILKRHQLHVIDSDRIARDVVKKGRWGWRRVVKEFGQGILLPNGEIDRYSSCMFSTTVFFIPVGVLTLASHTALGRALGSWQFGLPALGCLAVPNRSLRHELCCRWVE